MGGLPPTYIAQIDSAIQQGRGAAATILGQTYDVYRNGPQTNVSVISSGSLTIHNYPMRIRRSQKVAIENVPFDLLVITATCDNRQLQLGDILVETGYEAQPDNRFCVAQIRPTRETIMVRVENPAAIQRPQPDGGAASQQPISNGVPGTCVMAVGYGGITPFNREILTLTDGAYAFLPAGSTTPQASVPIGIQQRSRTRDRRDPGLPTRIAESEFYAYIPDCPGVEFAELDVIKATHEDNYEIRSLFTSDQSGLQGWICLLRKLAS